METIWHLVEAAITSVVMFAGMWTFFGKSLIKHVLERDADKFRADLKLEGDTQIERLKSSLQLASFEKQVQLSRLYARRANIIAELYKLLHEVPRYAGTYILQDPNSLEKQRTAKEKLLELYVFIENHRIYFPTHVCEKLDKFSGMLSHSITHFSIYWSIEAPTEGTRLEQRKVILDAVELLETILPGIRRELEGEFRKLLGA